jgi:hypothetical protein
MIRAGAVRQASARADPQCLSAARQVNSMGIRLSRGRGLPWNATRWSKAKVSDC